MFLREGNIFGRHAISICFIGVRNIVLVSRRLRKTCQQATVSICFNGVRNMPFQLHGQIMLLPKDKSFGRCQVHYGFSSR